jgi:chromosome segregation ATPase
MRLAPGGDDTDRLQAEIVQLKTKIHSMNMDHEDRLQEYESRIKQQAKSFEQVQADLRKLQDEKRELLTYKRDYLLTKDELATLQASLASNAKPSQEMHPDTLRLQQVQASVSSMQSANERLQRDNEDLKNANSKLESDVASLLQRLKTMAAGESQQAEEMARERQKLAVREKAWQDEREAMAAQLDARTAEVNRKTRELEAVREDGDRRIATLSAEIEQMNTRILAVDDENSDLKERIRALEDDMEEKLQLNAAVQERQKIEKGLLRENSSLKEQVDSLTASIDELTTQLKAGKEAAAAAARLHRGELETKDAVIQRLEAELKQANDTINEREQEIARIEQQTGSELRKDREKVHPSLLGTRIQNQAYTSPGGV